MSSSLVQEIAEQTALFNNLRTQNADANLIEEAKRKLGELKKAQGVLNAKGKDKKTEGEGEKKDRILLKTAKVRRLDDIGAFKADLAAGNKRLWTVGNALSSTH